MGDNILGVSPIGGICVIGKRISIIEEGDYFVTEHIAAHELAHNLGAVHDGELVAIDCPANDSYLMAPYITKFDPYTSNPWIFSICSVREFKKTIRNTTCLTNQGVYFNDGELLEYVKKLPGEVYTLDEQCKVINGPKSGFCGAKLTNVCQHMQCTDPKTCQCMVKTFSAATGTKCGTNMWCKKGRCVPKASK